MDKTTGSHKTTGVMRSEGFFGSAGYRLGVADSGALHRVTAPPCTDWVALQLCTESLYSYAEREGNCGKAVVWLRSNLLSTRRPVLVPTAVKPSSCSGLHCYQAVVLPGSGAVKPSSCCGLQLAPLRLVVVYSCRPMPERLYSYRPQSYHVMLCIETDYSCAQQHSSEAPQGGIREGIF